MNLDLDLNPGLDAHAVHDRALIRQAQLARQNRAPSDGRGRTLIADEIRDDEKAMRPLKRIHRRL